jgi:cobalamin synthase
MLIFRRIIGFSYDGVLLYLSFLLRDHLIPVLAGAAGFLLVQKKLALSGREEDTFLGVFSYMAGFMTLLNIADALRTWGNWDAYTLFLLPVLRMAMVLAVALVARRFYRWEGRNAAYFSGAAAACAVVLALSSFLYGANRITWSILLAVGFFLAACVVVAFRFPRVLRG